MHTGLITDAAPFAARRRFIVAAALAGCVLYAPAAYAQDATTTPDPSTQASAADAPAPGEQLQDIVVTAQRRAENIQTVPLTINAFTGETLAAKGITNVADLGIVTPGLVFSNIVGYAIPYLRGVGVTSTGPGFENPIAIYVDGVYYAAQAGGLLSLNNIASIEVDKGPQGTLFGRNATGGAIQITTKTPSHTLGGLVSGGYGNYDTVKGAFYLTGGLSETVAADIAIDYSHQGDGYGTNLTLGKPLEINKNFSARSKFYWTPSSRTAVTLIGDYTRTRGRPALLPAPGTLPRGNRLPAPNPRDGYGLTQPFSRTNQWGVSLKFEQELDFAKLVSITAYRDTFFHGRFDNLLTDDPTNDFFVDTTEPHKQISEEIQLVSNKAGPFDWVVGGYFLRERASFNRPTFIGGGSVRGVASIVGRPDTRGVTGAAFAEATYAVTPGTKLIGGLRYTYEHRSLDANNTTTLSNGFVIFRTSDVSKVYKQVTWRLAVTQDLTDGVLAYGSYNRGFKSGGFNTGTYNPVVLFLPEKIDAYEAGVKSEFLDRRVRLNVAGFYYDYENLQITSYPRGSLIVSNARKARIYGLDVDTEIAVTSALSITGGLELLSAKYRSYPTAPFSTPTPVINGSTFTVFEAAGRYLSKAPRSTFNIGADYRQPTAFGKATASIVYSYNNGWFGDPDNRLRQPSYGVVNATIGLETASQLSITVWGKNLTDKRYAVILAAQSQGDYNQYAAPRTYGATLTKKF